MKKIIVSLGLQVISSVSLAAWSVNEIKADAYMQLTKAVNSIQETKSNRSREMALQAATSALLTCQGLGEMKRAKLNYCNDVIENVLSDLDIEISKGNFSPGLKGQVFEIFSQAYEAAQGGVERSLKKTFGGVERGR